jgi:hypothetical protein
LRPLFPFPSLSPDVQFRLTEPDFQFMRDIVEGIGVFVMERRLSGLDPWIIGCSRRGRSQPVRMTELRNSFS